MIVTMTDAQRAGYCAKGTKGWFKVHGLDFRDFLKNGIDEATFLATGCGHAKRVVEMKRARNG